MQPVKTCLIPSLRTDTKLIKSSFFQHIVIITFQDKHLIPLQYQTEQITSGLFLSAPKWDDIELDYVRKWAVHTNWK